MLTSGLANGTLSSLQNRVATQMREESVSHLSFHVDVYIDEHMNSEFQHQHPPSPSPWLCLCPLSPMK